MKIIIAPDSFKGSLSATEVAEAIADGILRASSETECVLIPLADGGEGTVEALVKATSGRIVQQLATGPMGNRIDSFFGLLGDGATAVIEMAAASGLPLIPEDQRNPMVTTSFGAGELIRAALDIGCRKLILGIGGSATNDGGIGTIQALGGKFLDQDGVEVGFGGKELARIVSIDLSELDSRLKETDITVASDVDNPLTGDRGASAVFGPQKGATPEMINLLDAGLANLAEVIRRDLGVDIEFMPGAGAAGGLGGGTIAFLNAKLRPGIQIVLDATRFREHLAGCDLVITGEGRIDSQTLHGKTISGVLLAALAKGVPVLALAGSVDPSGYELIDHGALALLSITDKPMNLQEAQSHAEELLSRVAEQAFRLFAGGTAY